MSKTPTPKQLAARKAASERMKARHAAAKAAQQAKTEVVSAVAAERNEVAEEEAVQTEQQAPEAVKQPDFSEQPADTIAANNSTEELIKLVLEMMKQNNNQVPQGAQAIGGQLTGTTEKFSTNAENYPNPSERLAKEPKLERFAFDFNYKLEYSVVPIRYQTIDKVWMVEPKFQLKLIKKQIDQDTGMDTGGRYMLRNLTLFEDPEAAIVIAQEQGLDVNSDNEAAFLNEMRYLRMREWLLDCFYPAGVTNRSDTTQRVIDNRVVDFYTEATDSSAKIPFDQMTRFKV